MAEGSVSFLLEQVKEVVLGYGNLIAGAEKEFELLTDDLASLKAHLKQISEKKNKEAQEREIERRMRDAVYVVEDTIDTCFIKLIQTKGKNVFARALDHTGISLAKEVKSIRQDMVQPLLAEARHIAGKTGGVQAPPTGLEWRAIPIRQDRVVGFDGEEETITGYLKEFRQELDVISIVGIPGQGKTTLAWKVYQNEIICHHFPILIWIPISQVFNSKDVFLQILKIFRPSLDTSGVDDEELAQIVRECLEKERFLLVLDDVWSTEAWDTIKEVLPIKNGEGKVLITTRLEEVGRKSRVSHNLRFLDDNESWKLLQYEVFGNLEDCPKDLEKIGYLVAKKCDGVPLTIVVIGGVLMDEYNENPSEAESEWKIVANSVSKALIDSSGAKNRILDVVKMSYDVLTDELRDCFAYLGVFPEDYEIPATMLCGLWISEGFVRPWEGRSMEECAEQNMMHLINRNLIKVDKRNHMGEVKTCRVHDMIRAFCISISKEENLCEEITRSNSGKLTPSPSELQNSHRLCFRSDLPDFLSGNPSGQHVRSFLCFYEQPHDLDKKHISAIPDGFNKLRILESKCIKFDTFPVKVTKLVHLRYLTLYIKTLPNLPASFAQLWNLQSLVVETKSQSIAVKANIWTMVRLRLLKTRAALLLSDKWEGEAGDNLHTLHQLAPESCTPAVSRKAKNLKNLGISGKLTSNFFETGFLEKLQRLEKLKLVNTEAHQLDMLNSLPRHNCFPPNLRRLTLTKTTLGWQHMSTLAMIKSLETLKLKDNAFVGVKWNLDLDTFPNLLLLLIHDADLVLWEATPRAFPRLRFLLVKNCDNLKEIPQCVGANLEKLDIERVRFSVVQSAEKIKESQKERPTGKTFVPFKLNVGPSCKKE